MQRYKFMKPIQLFSLCLVLFIVQGQIRDFSRSRIPDLERIKASLFQTADCYQGSIQIAMEQGTSSKISYTACFAQQTQSCSYVTCFNGWIANYTSAQTGLVEGYPANPSTAPIFRLDINSAADFVVRKDPNLGQEFDRIIDIACIQFDPTVGPSSGRNLRVADSKSQVERVYIPQFNFAAAARGSDNILRAESTPQRVAISELKGQGASILRSLSFDTSLNKVAGRNDNIQVSLSNDIFSSSKSGNALNGLVKLSLSRKGTGSYFKPSFEDRLNQIGSEFSVADLQARRADTNRIDIGGVPELEQQKQPEPTETSFQGIDLQAYISSKVVPDWKGSLSDNVIERPYTEKAISSSASSASSVASSFFSGFRGRLLAEVVLFSQEITLYEKVIFGNTFRVSIFIEVKLIDNVFLQIRATLKIQAFGQVRQYQIFYKKIYAGFNWSYNDTISGNWNFNIHLVLPPPVSFISLTFSISIQYSIPINLNANGQPSLPTSYTCTVTSSIDPYVYLDASGSISVGLAQAGAFVNGVVLSAKTDPKIVLVYYFNTPRKIVVSVDWKFHLKPYSFNWGFRYRFKKLFGWYPWQYIGPYTVNVYSQTFPILAFTKEFKL